MLQVTFFLAGEEGLPWTTPLVNLVLSYAIGINIPDRGQFNRLIQLV